jgi:hypothetical protein
MSLQRGRSESGQTHLLVKLEHELFTSEVVIRVELPVLCLELLGPEEKLGKEETADGGRVPSDTALGVVQVLHRVNVGDDAVAQGRSFERDMGIAVFELPLGDELLLASGKSLAHATSARLGLTRSRGVCATCRRRCCRGLRRSERMISASLRKRLAGLTYIAAVVLEGEAEKGGYAQVGRYRGWRVTDVGEAGEPDCATR